ncbi:hypothetical protein [Porphyrobacter sp. AAP60]|uniref:hypothetical protein n=1 Tax=Porphyrobacter sp. AAP60 TaxID=1523423 RepID=UPI0006B9C67B|nr:hypothetical protein [Porphyrobacter sp. AAP60]KPF62498.1 hypothetical protein IP79_12640 [Porphyrobacter sp. AAP60]
MKIAGPLEASTLTAALLHCGAAKQNSAKGLAGRPFPAQFACDWIRVYRCAGDPETGRAGIR